MYEDTFPLDYNRKLLALWLKFILDLVILKPREYVSLESVGLQRKDHYPYNFGGRGGSYLCIANEGDIFILLHTFWIRTSKMVIVLCLLLGDQFSDSEFTLLFFEHKHIIIQMWKKYHVFLYILHNFTLQGGPKRMAPLVVSLFNKQVFFVFCSFCRKNQKGERKGAFLWPF